ncbi:MAG: helix-turn-helix transcriptional regulator [Bacteriovoracaceae bacterium]
MGMRCFDHVAKIIKAKRQAHPKGYSQSELSHVLGYKNGQFISNVERGLCNIPLKMLRKVCEILDINPEDLKEAMIKDIEFTLNNYLRTGSNQVRKHDRSNHDAHNENHEGDVEYKKVV